MKHIIQTIVFAFSLCFYSIAVCQPPDNGPKTVVASGTDTYTITSTAPSIYTLGESFKVRFTNANTGAATLNRSGKGAKAITKNGTTALSSGDIAAGQVHLVVYDGTRYQCTTCSSGGGSASPGGADTQLQFNDGGSFNGNSALTFNKTTNQLGVGDSKLYSYTTNTYLTTSGGNASGSFGNNIVIGHDMPTGAMDVGNIILGHSAGKLSTSHYNVLLGEAAGRFQTTAGENVAIGYRALYQNVGEDNIGIGFGPAQNYTGSGRNITFIGYYAGSPGAAGASGTDLTSGGSHSIFIGSYVRALHASEAGQINIGGVFFSRGNGATNPPPAVELGNASVYVSNPTARWHLPAGSATAGKASFKIDAGTVLGTTEAGAIENDGTHLYYTAVDGGARFKLNAPAISSLSVASSTNTIDNTQYSQHWQWSTLAGSSGLKLSSTSTAAASNAQKVFEIDLSGANGTAGQSTYAGYFSNTHTGATSTNYGLYTTASGGTTSNISLWSGGYTILGETSKTSGVTIRSSSGADWLNFDNGRVIYFNSAGSNDRLTPTSGKLAFTVGGATAINSYEFYNGTTLTATSGTAKLVSLNRNITLSSGTLASSMLDITGTLNVSAGSNLLYGINYDPTITSVAGATHLAARFTSGSVLVGGTTLTPSAIIDLQSTTQALVLPRMTTTQRDAIASPSAGMLIYNTTTNKLNVYTTAWEEVTSL